MSRRFPAPHLPDLGQRVALDPATSHHVLVVCLTPRGTPVRLFCNGRECDGVLAEGADGLAVVESTSLPRPLPDLGRRVLVIGLPKRPAWERILRMGTELGVTEFRPFHARRSISKGEKLDRWQRICDDAARQSERGQPPTVHRCADLAAILGLELPDHRVVCVPGSPTPLGAGGDAALLIGPEGGLDASELERAEAAGFLPVGLCSTVLRADTAVVAALARLS